MSDTPGSQVKYTLTLTGWEQSSKQDGKSWYEWSGSTSIVIAAGTLTDNAGNTNSEKTASIGHVDFIKPKIESSSISGNTVTFKVIDKYIDTTDQVTTDEITAIYIDGTKVDSITKDSLTRAEIKGTVNGSEKVVGYTYTLKLGNVDQSRSSIITDNNIGALDTTKAYGQYSEYSGTLQVDIAEGAAKDTSGNTTNAVTKKSLGFLDSINPNVTYKYMGVSRYDKHESASTNPDIDYGEELEEPDEYDNTFRMIFDITDKYYDTTKGGTLTTSMTKEQILQYLTIKIGDKSIAEINTDLSDPDIDVQIEDVDPVYAYGTIKKTVNGSIQSVSEAEIGKRYTLRITNLEQAFRNEAGFTDYSGVITVALNSGLVKDTSGRGNSSKTITSGVNLAEGNNAGGSSKVVDVVNPILVRRGSSVDLENKKVAMTIIGTDKYYDFNETLTTSELGVYINGVKYDDAVIEVTEETAKLSGTDEHGKTIQYGETYKIIATNLPADMTGLTIRVSKGAIKDQYNNPNLECEFGTLSYLVETSEETEEDSRFLSKNIKNFPTKGVKRNEIEQVVFEASTAGRITDTSWDVSQQADESIWAWTTEGSEEGKYIVHIASDVGIITANPNSSYLFSWVGTNSTAEEVIVHLDYLQVGEVTDMSYMFSNFAYNNTNMTTFSLEGAGFNTANVVNMTGMFQNCGYTGMTFLDLGSQFMVENVEDMTDMFNGCGYTAMTMLDLGPVFSQIPNAKSTGFITDTGKSEDCIIYVPERIYSYSKAVRTDTGTQIVYDRGTKIEPFYSPVWEKVEEEGSCTLTDDGVMTVIVKGHATKTVESGHSPDEQISYISPITHTLTEENVVAYVDGEKAENITINKVEKISETEFTEAVTVTDEYGMPKEVTGLSEVRYKITLTNVVEGSLQEGKTYEEWSGNISLQLATGTLKDYFGKNINRNTVGKRAGDNPTTDREAEGKMFVDDIKPVIKWVSASKDATAKTQKITFDVIDKYLDRSTDGRIVESEITVYVDGEVASNVTKSISRSVLYREGTSRIVGERYELTLSNFGKTMNDKGYQDWSGTVTLDIAAGAAKDKSGNVTAAYTGMKGTYSDFLAPAIKYSHSSTDMSGNTYTMTFTVTDKYYKSSGSTPFTTADITNGNITVKMQNGQRDASGNLIVYNLKDLASKGVTMTLTSTELKVPSMKMTTNTTNLTVGTVSNQLIGHTYQLVISNLDQAFIEDGATTANYSGVVMVSLPKDRIVDTTGLKNAATTITSGINVNAGTTSGSATEIDVVNPIVQKVSSSINPLSGTATVKIKVTDTYFKASDALASGEINVIVNGTKVTSGLTKTVTTTTPLKETRVKNDGIGTTATEEVQYGSEITFTISGINTGAHQVKVQIAEGALTDNTGNGNLMEEFILYNALKTVGYSVGTPENTGTSAFLGISTIQRQDIENVTFLEKMPTSTNKGTYNGTFDANGKVVVDNTSVWDVSAEGDDTIVAWYTTNANGAHTVYIASDEVIASNKDSGYLFAHIANSTKCTAKSVFTNLELLNTTSVTSMFAMFFDIGNAAMTKLDLGDNFYTSNVTNMRSMFLQCGQNYMTEIDFGNHFDTSKVTTMYQMFKLCGTSAMTKLDLSAEGINFDTSKVNTMYAMFYGCGKNAMTTFNLGSNFDTSAVTDMNSMFREWGYKMSSLNFGSKFITTSVTDMSYMFYSCGRGNGTANVGMTTLNLSSSNFDTTNVKNMSYMFYECGYYNMTTLTLGSKFIASSATDMSYMFAGCGYSKMTELKLGNQFNASSAINMSHMFERCGYKVMETLDLGTNFNSVKAEDMSYMFSYCGYGTDTTGMTTLTLGDKFIASAATNVTYMFDHCGYKKMPSLTLGSGFSVSSATDLSYMFKNCGYTSMTTLNLGTNFNASSATTMTGMFEGTGYTAMKELDLGKNFNLSSATDLSYMFANCGYKAMTTLKLGENFNSIKAENMSYMFQNCGYTALTTIDYGDNFVTTNVKNMSYMFNNCAYATGKDTEQTFTFSLPSNFNTDKVTNMRGMFKGLGYHGMDTFNLNSGFNTANVNNMIEMFNQCGTKKLKKLDLGADGVNFDTTKVTDMTDMFNYMGSYKLEYFSLGSNFNTENVTSMRNMFYWCAGQSEAIKEFSLGDKFNTSKVKYFRSMFNDSLQGVKALDLGDNFYTTSVAQNNSWGMNRMFMAGSNFRVIDLGPHFTIMSAPTDGDDFGDFSSNCIIYAPEAVYANEHLFKLNKEDTTDRTSCLTVEAKIVPIYKPEWTKESVTVDTTNKTVEIKLKASAYRVEDRILDFGGYEYPYKINYVSDIASYSDSLTSLVNASRVYIDGVDVTETTKPTISKTVSLKEQTNSTTGVVEVVGFTVKLSNLEEAVRQTGVPFKEWSGNILVQVEGRGSEATLAEYTKDILVDEFGNQSMDVIQEDGVWVEWGAHEETPATANATNTMFADFIKPEITYQYSSSDINHTDETLTVVFEVTDNYFNTSSIGSGNITVTMLDTNTTASVTKTITVLKPATETTTASGKTYKTDGYIYYDIDGDGTKDKIGKRYQLVISNIDKGAGINYSGPMSITFASGVASDKSGNTNNATTITIGINEDDGNAGTTPDDTLGYDQGEQVIVDVVDPVWQNETPTIGTNSVSLTLKAIDKYTPTSTLAKGDIKIYSGEDDITDKFTVALSGATEITNGKSYTLTLSKYAETDEQYATARESERWYREFSGPISIVIPAGKLVDNYGNTDEIGLTIDIDMLDTIKPDVTLVSSTTPSNTQTIVFDITDKYLAESKINGTAIAADGTIDLSKVDTSNILVYVDDVEATTITKTISNIEELKAIVDGAERTIGYRYTLQLSNIIKATRASNSYLEYSGTLSVKIAAGTAKDEKGNENTEKTLYSEFMDNIAPNLKYVHSESTINASGNTYTMKFSITDKYYDATNSTPLSLTDIQNGTIKILMQNGQVDADNKAIVYDIYQQTLAEAEKAEAGELTSPITIGFTATEIKKSMNMTVDGTVKAVTNQVIGHTYTLTISNLEKSKIFEGLNTLGYSGVITVAVPADRIVDTSGLKNVAKTITSGLDLPTDPGEGDVDNGTPIDVVEPIWRKTGLTFNDAEKTATITIEGTDTYFDEESYDANPLLEKNIKIFEGDDDITVVNGNDITTESGIQVALSTVEKLEEDRLVEGTITKVKYGVKYTITLTNFVADGNNLKLQLPAGLLKDSSNNLSKVTDIMLFSTLKATNTETAATSGFLGNTTIQRQHIEKIVFQQLNSMDEAPEINNTTCWDVSEEQDESILAWYETPVTRTWTETVNEEEVTVTADIYTVYIGSDAKIFANIDSRFLFSYMGYSGGCNDTKVIENIELLNTTNVTNMASMFKYCGYNAMTTLNLGNNFKTQKVTNMNSMFAYCGYKAMTSFTLGDNFDTSIVEDMSYMFNYFGYTALSNFDLNPSENATDEQKAAMFNTSSVTNMSYMFNYLGAKALVTFDFGDNFYTSSVTDMSRMFYALGTVDTTCNLTGLDLGDNFDTSNVTNMNAMFSMLRARIVLDLGESFFVSNVTDMKNMFAHTNYLTAIDLGPNFTKIASENTSMFEYGASNGAKIYAPEAIYANENAFKLSSTDSTTIERTRGPIIPFYAPEWIVEEQTVDSINKIASFTIKSEANKTGTIVAGHTISYSSDVTESLTKSKLKVLADGSNVTSQVDIELIVDSSNANDVKYTIEVSGYEDIRTSQLKVEIPRKTADDTYGNTNIEKYLIIYTSLRKTADEVADSGTLGAVAFLGNSNVYRNSVEKVVFQNNLDGAPTTIDGNKCWDVSAQEDESIIAWRTNTAPYTVYIGSESEMYANQDSTRLFSYIGYGEACDEPTVIQGLNYLNTTNVEKMNLMFWYCGFRAMTTLNLGDNFRTENVTEMSSMFAYCGYTAMTSFELGDNFDTSNVTTMSGMFNRFGYTALTNFDLSPSATATDEQKATMFNTQSVTNMSSMFSYMGYTKLQTFDFGDNFDTSSVTNMSSMFACMSQGSTETTGLRTLTLGDKFDTSNVTNMSSMFATMRGNIRYLDLGDKFYTNKVTTMKNMFAHTNNISTIDLGPHFTQIADEHTDMFTYCGGSATIYAPEAIYSDKTAFKLSATDSTTISWTRGTVNPIYKPEWSVVSHTLNTSNHTMEITIKGSANKMETGTGNVAINHVESVTSSLVKEDIKVYLGATDRTTITNPTLSQGTTSQETVTLTTATETEPAVTKTIDVVTYKVTLSNLDDVERVTGIPYNEWSGYLKLNIAGRGQDTSTYTANTLVEKVDRDGDEVTDTNANQSMMEVNTTGTWLPLTFGNEFFDFIKPEIRYEYANTQIVGLPDSADTADAEKKVTVVFDVLDKYFSSSSLANTDITLNVINTDATTTTVDASKFTRALAVKTIDTETTNATSGLTYKTNGDIYYDVDGDGTAEKVGQRYELVISGLDQGNGFDYSGPMNIAFASGKVKDKGPKGDNQNQNSNDSWTITIGINETDGDSTDGGDSGTQQIVDLVNPIWTVGSKTTTTAADGTTTANIEMIVTDKYFKTSSLTKDQIQVLVDGEDKSEELNITFSGPTSVTNGHKYVFSFSNFEESYANFIAERTKYFADSSTGRLYREFSGPVQVIVPKGAAVDNYGNDSEALTVDLGTLDALKPEVVKVSSSVEIIEDSDDPNNILDSKQTIVFDITDKYFGTQGITKTDVSKIKVMIDGKEATCVTKTITNIEELPKATINGAQRTIGYRYTLELTNFKDVKSASDAYTNWSGDVSIQVLEGAATDLNGSSNATTTLVGEYIDVVNPDITYIFSETDIDYDQKTFTMEFEITDKYFDPNNASTKELVAKSTTNSEELGANDINILIDMAEDGNYQAFNSEVKMTLTSTDVTATVDGVADVVIGKHYTLLLENLEQEEIQYGGIVSVAIPEKVIYDSTSGTDTKALYNYGTTLTSGIDVIGDIEDEDTPAEIIDVISPVWEKVESSADPINKTATITMKGTDNKEWGSTDLTDKVKVYVNGVDKGTTGLNISSATSIYKVPEDTTSTKIGEQYTFTISGYDTEANQVKIVILAGAMVDHTGENFSVQSNGIAYNVLKSAASETSADIETSGESSVFLGGTIQRQQIENVKFVDLTRLQMNSWASAISAENSTYWDVSAQGDKSIVAYYTDADSNGAYEVQIGSYWEIFGNRDSSYLFSYVGYGTDCDATETVTELNKLNTSYVTNMASMFEGFGYRKMTTLNLGDFDTANVTDMSNMFNGCGQLAMTTFNLGTAFKTAKVTNMSGMFQNCGQAKLTTLDLGATGVTFNTSAVTDMSNMFNGLSAITTFSFGSNFNTSKVTNMSGMFQNFGLGLTTLDLGATGVTFNTSLVTDMSNMFNGCGATSMTTLNLGNSFDTKKVTNMSGMFQGFAQNSSTMKNLDLGNAFYTTAVTDMSNMFNGCGAAAMIVLDLGPHFTNIPTTRTDMFKDCGTAQLIIYAPESIYESQTSFK